MHQNRKYSYLSYLLEPKQTRLHFWVSVIVEIALKRFCWARRSQNLLYFPYLSVIVSEICFHVGRWRLYCSFRTSIVESTLTWTHFLRPLSQSKISRRNFHPNCLSSSDKIFPVLAEALPFPVSIVVSFQQLLRARRGRKHYIRHLNVYAICHYFPRSLYWCSS